MKYAIKTRGTNSGNHPVGTIVYDLRGHEELRLLIEEYDPQNSDWGFRKGVMLDILARHPAPVSQAGGAAQGSKGRDLWECSGCGSKATIEQIKAEGFLSCCPERKMGPAMPSAPRDTPAETEPRDDRGPGNYQTDGGQ